MLFLMFPAAAFAAEGNSSGVPAKRTILMYVCGSNLESNSAMATYNLRQILNAEFSKDEDVKFIIMTGGASRIAGFDKLISAATDLKVRVAEEPADCVVKGCGESLKYIDLLRKDTLGVSPITDRY